MWFVRVPEPPRAAKNRMHFDLRSPVTMRVEVDRLTALGATIAEWFDSHTTMHDPEGKTAKNRMHFDLRSPRTMHAEVERLTALGATVAARFNSHTTLHDPEGNVFCVELGPEDDATG